MFEGARIAEQQRALPEIVQQECWKDEPEPSRSQRGSGEMPHIGHRGSRRRLRRGKLPPSMKKPAPWRMKNQRESVDRVVSAKSMRG